MKILIFLKILDRIKKVVMESIQNEKQQNELKIRTSAQESKQTTVNKYD
jgi:hypothetical protein